MRQWPAVGRVAAGSSVVTANVLLSEPGADFAGAELYVLGPEHANADTLGAREQFERALPGVPGPPPTSLAGTSAGGGPPLLAPAQEGGRRGGLAPLGPQ